MDRARLTSARRRPSIAETVPPMDRPPTTTRSPSPRATSTARFPQSASSARGEQRGGVAHAVGEPVVRREGDPHVPAPLVALPAERLELARAVRVAVEPRHGDRRPPSVLEQHRPGGRRVERREGILLPARLGDRSREAHVCHPWGAFYVRVGRRVNPRPRRPAAPPSGLPPALVQ